ncbi:MAG: hypothetical protein ACE5JR_05690 [Gemmatimonadota bacterium]
MSLNLRALSLASALLWGGLFLFIGALNLMFPSYGAHWLDFGASIYPGYHGPSGFGSVIIVTLYGLVDGAVGGAIFAWLYNRLLPA